MSQKFAQSLKVNRGFVPSQPVAGEANDTIYAGKNIVFKGSPQAVHAESFRGSQTVQAYGFGLVLPPSAGHALAGVNWVQGSDELVSDIFVFPPAGTAIMGPDGGLYIITNIYTPLRAKISPAYMGPSVIDLTGQIVIPKTLCAMNDLLAICFGGGNAISLPQGHIMSCGLMRGLFVYANPAPTGNTRELFAQFGTPPIPLLHTRLDDATYNPIPRALGFTVPPPPVLVAIAGGIKNMPAGRYSIRISRSSLATTGYGNPSEAAEIQITAGQKIEATFPDPEDEQDAWRVFCSLYSVAEGITGPWYELAEVSEASLYAGFPPRVRAFEWRDYEVAGAQLVTFDNNPPPTARFVVMFGGMPVLISCYGPPLIPGTNLAPGPSVQPGKPYNIEAFPPGTSLAMGPVQNIISFVEGEGRLYLATNSYIHILSLTGNPDQPLTVRPYVQCAIIRHNALVYIEGTLYGFSAQGPVRISGEATGVEDRIFAAPVRAVTERWHPARVFVAYDPHNEAILWVHTNDSKVGGFWRTMVLSYSLTLGIWSTPLFLEDPTKDVVVTGVATLGSRAYMVTETELLMWDAGARTTEWNLATPFIDQPGVAGAKKNIRHITATHRGANTEVDIIGMVAGGSEPVPFTAAVPDLKAALPGSASAVVTSVVHKINVRNLRLYLIKLSGINAAADPLPNRVDEIIIDGNVHGPVT